MKRAMCVKNSAKNLCPYTDLPTGVLLAEYCDRCNLPDLYKNKGKVPETPTQMVATGYEEPAPSVSTELDKMYYYLLNHTDTFKGMSMDQQGELMNQLAKVLDKYGLV